MTEAMFKRIVEEISREKPDCEIWPTFYGEALLLGDNLWRWLDYAASIGCDNIVLNSNGILLERHIDQVLASPLRRFILSLDAFQPETFKKIRVGAAATRFSPQWKSCCAAGKNSAGSTPLSSASFRS